MDDLALAADFPQATRERWQAAVAAALKGADVEERLVSRSYDGLRIEPLAPKGEGAPLGGRASPGPWRVGQRVDHPEPAEANALLLADLEGGADLAVLSLAGAPTARGFGVRLDTPEDLDRLLSGVLPELIQIRLETAPFEGRRAADLIVAFAERRGLDPASLSVDFGLDPIGDAARTGGFPLPYPELTRRAGEIAADLRRRGFGGNLMRADGRGVHEAGGGEAQELAALLATGVAYLRVLEAAGLSLDEARGALSFLLVADVDQVLTVAKLRALRRLWARVEAACGLDPRPVRLDAETAWRVMTRRDPWVNLLRGTVAAFSSAVGGADSVTVVPFTSPLGLPDAFARRVARNAQIVLAEEANLFRVADPAAGAGSVEALTEALCREAWAQFQEIEREGGVAASLEAGALQARVAATARERERNVARRKDAITGTSEFPDLSETPVAVLAPAPAPPAAPVGSFPALPSRRLAEGFEALRDRAETLPDGAASVLLCTLGPPAAYTARASFSKNFFASAGFVTNIAELHGELPTDMPKLICLCSSDDLYRIDADRALTTLRTMTQAPIYIAGRPDKLEELQERFGPIIAIFAGCDALSLLGSALDQAA